MLFAGLRVGLNKNFEDAPNMTLISAGRQGLSLRSAFWIIAGLLFVGSGNMANASPISIQNSVGAKVSVETDGAYTIVCENPAWTFGGEIGKPLSNLSASNGRDGSGAYDEISFSYFDAAPKQAGIRLYREKRAILFTLKYPEGGLNDSSFPALSRFPQTPLHVTYDGQFAQYSFFQMSPASPWIFFDGGGATFILSPAANFMVASLSTGFRGELTSGIDRSVYSLARGFTHQTLLVIENGLNKAFNTWGRTITEGQGKSRPGNDADAGLTYLGYWTDNGATYYYDYDLTLGYQGTLLAVRDYFRRENIPLGYMQLDSWWYPKGRDGHWTRGDGIYRYLAHPDVFPDGLKSFQQRLGLPLITHARWIDQNSPYRQEYRMSNNVSIDPRYWDNAIGYIKDAGVISYEQDWLEYDATAVAEDQDAFLGQMARACRDKNLTMQYCMATPRHFLQSSKYGNLTTIRTSGDRFTRGRWDAFLYASRLASALGVWPWTDVFMSYETTNLLLANLSGGMVGVGDRIGTTDKDNLFKAVRKDGVIVKPDAPIVPSDQTFLREARGAASQMVAYTYTDHGELKPAYVFVYDRGAGPSISFEPWSFGLNGKTYVYNYFNKTGRVVDQHNAFKDVMTASEAYYIAAPIGPSGIAMLGDEGKFVSLGKKRINSLIDDGTVQAAVSFAKNEDSVTLHGYAPAAPSVAASKGSVGVLTYDRSTKRFRFSVSPDSNATAAIKIIPAPSSVIAAAGLTGEYHSGIQLDDSRITRVDKGISFEWDGPPSESIDSLSYSVRWSGKVVPRYSEPYTLYTTTTGGVRLWINGVLLIDNWSTHGQTENSAIVPMAAGQAYEIKMEYYNQAPHGVAALAWSSPSLAKQIIPKKRLLTTRIVYE